MLINQFHKIAAQDNFQSLLSAILIILFSHFKIANAALILPLIFTAMSVIYFQFPLQLNKAFEGTELPTCNLRQSITKNLALIITTRFGEHRANESFGCEIWNLDFEIIVSERTWEEKLRQSLMRSISSHEQRLTGIEINVTIREVEKMKNSTSRSEVKKRVDIKLTGSILKTGESFDFSTNLFLSPLTVA